MELALYCPLYGYYEKEGDNIGQTGDFYTSVSVGSLFGQLLAFQFADWLSEMGEGEPDLRIAEAAAHDGALARDLLSWLREHRSRLYDRLTYYLLEPSYRSRNRQTQTLAGFQDNVRWVSHPSELDGLSGRPGFEGIIFSNELLDAMPVHRLGWDATNQVWFQWGVTLRDGEFAWTKMALGEGLPLPALPGELLKLLPDGFTTEICPAAERWWREAALVLHRGKLVAIDYGLEAEDFFAPERGEGTLRAYHGHRASSNLLVRPGEQDLTAHVNWTAIRTIGEAAGLRTDGVYRQESFLTQIAGRFWSEGAGFGGGTSAQIRQFQTLVHPEHLGRAFQVLVQSRLR